MRCTNAHTQKPLINMAPHHDASCPRAHSQQTADDEPSLTSLWDGVGVTGGEGLSIPSCVHVHGHGAVQGGLKAAPGSSSAAGRDRS